MDQKKVILVTGSRKGIGLELVKYYSEHGYNVIGCSREIGNFKHKYYSHYQTDITDEKTVLSMFRDIRQKYNRLDILINNAGVNQALSPVLILPFRSAENTIRINFLGSFLMAREAIKIMMKNSFGRIINFGSMAVKHEEKGEAIYTASKAAIIHFTRILAKEVYQYGITCNVVSPSAIDTDLIKNINREALNKVLNRNAIPELGTTGELINTINWLIDQSCSNITGQNIYMGGV